VDKDSQDQDDPKQIVMWARNKRLYKTLQSMGLFVDPIRHKTGEIEYFIVSTGLPICPYQPGYGQSQG